MNFVDIVFILLLLAFLALGFFEGTIKLLVAIISFYVSIILASLYFQYVGGFLRQRLHTSPDMAQILGFTSILFVMFILLMVAGFYTFRYAKLPVSLDFIDRIIGTLLGLVMGGLVLGMLALILDILLIQGNPAGEMNFPIMHSLQSSARSSTMIGYFKFQVLPMILNLVRPFLPVEAFNLFGVR